jgi:hypothetical protein
MTHIQQIERDHIKKGQLQSAQPCMLLALCYPNISGRAHLAKFILVLCSPKENVTGGLDKQWPHAILNHFSYLIYILMVKKQNRCTRKNYNL